MAKQCILAVLLMIGSFTGMGQQQSQKEKGEVIYHICQRSFYDSNGDAQGDLRGLMQKLPYLQDLGITSVLLFPLYEADCYHNYFAKDFDKIDPEFGTMEDYLLLVKEIHKRGMKIYLDMETQYVTDKHVWWKEAVGNPSSRYSEYILFEDSAHKIPATILADLRELNSYDGSRIKITTVNLRSKQVLDYNRKLFAYFVDPNQDGKLDDGVDGFRLDHCMDNLDGKPELTHLFSDFWSVLLNDLKKINPQLSNVAEQADWREDGFDYLNRAGVDRVFGFGLQRAILSFNKQELSEQADKLLAQCPKGKEQVIFIENHDMDRVASLEKNPDKQKLAATLMLLIDGVPSIYYGQEIGMTGKGGGFGNNDGNDIPRREAFEWYKTTEGKGMAIWYRNTGPWWDQSNLKNNDGISLEEQSTKSGSLFNHYKKMIRLRQGDQALSAGRYAAAVNDNAHVFSFLRQYENRVVLVAVNLSGERQTAVFKDPYVVRKQLLGEARIENKTIRLSPYEAVVFEVK
jgi:glycosidase